MSEQHRGSFQKIEGPDSKMNNSFEIYQQNEEKFTKKVN